jgi:iron-sulfur cluster assembly protein
MTMSASTQVAEAPAPVPAPSGFTFSPGAVAYAKKRLEQRGTPQAAVRVGVKGGGCSGFSYHIEFSDDPPRKRDTVYELDGTRFYIDAKSLAFLAGSQLEYEKTVMFQGFKFVNPREATRCGCGHSFTVK